MHNIIVLKQSPIFKASHHAPMPQVIVQSDSFFITPLKVVGFQTSADSVEQNVIIIFIVR
jgi:hypothetical protein